MLRRLLVTTGAIMQGSQHCMRLGHLQVPEEVEAGQRIFQVPAFSAEAIQSWCGRKIISSLVQFNP